MADHTLLQGVQAALDRRLRNRQLDLQAQVAESQMGDRDAREQDMRWKIIQQHNDLTAKRAADAGKPDPNAWRETPDQRKDREISVVRERGDGNFNVAHERGSHGDYQAETRADATVDAGTGHDEASKYGADKRLEGTKYATDNKKFAPPRPARGGSGNSLPPIDREILEVEKQINQVQQKLYGGDAGQASKFVPEGMRANQAQLKTHLGTLNSRLEALRKQKAGSKSEIEDPG